jgi:cytochrome P450
MALPPGPKSPRQLQSLEWLLRPIQFLDRNHRRYGDFFTIRIANFNAVLVSEPAIIREVFTGDPDVLHAGKANAAPLEPILGRHSVLLLDGPEHMRQRKLMLPSFQGERMRRYHDLIVEITRDEIARLPTGRPFALRGHTQAMTLEVIMRAVFGITDTDRLDSLRTGLRRLLSFGASQLALAAVAFPRIRQTVGRKLWNQFLATRRRVDEILWAEIRERRNNPETAKRDDVLSILLGARDEQGRAMSDEELRDELMTLLVAGHETTATALAWAFDLLLHNPNKLARLRSSLQESPDGGDYLDAAIKETLRLRPVVPAVARELQEPLELNGYALPTGTRVAPNIYLTHMRPELYPSPTRFEPERFLDGDTDTYSWIPFGGGIRRCLGAAFALYEMKVAIPVMLESLELRAAAARPERIRRRVITFAPEHDTMVVAEPKAPEPLGERQLAA